MQIDRASFVPARLQRFPSKSCFISTVSLMRESRVDEPKLRMGLIGGGGKGFIGRVHATAATLDRQADLVAGAFSSDPQKAKKSAFDFGVSERRAYRTYRELLESESCLPSSERIHFVSIATPNYTHAEIALAALESGFHVVCDKPMTTQLSDALRLAEAVETSGKVFVLTHNYSGYPMIRQAREMIQQGDLGEILAIRVSYKQGWMHGMNADSTPERGAWKRDPLKNGQAGSLGDVGTHAFHLLRFVTGQDPESLMCKMNSFSGHHELDDYGSALFQMKGGAFGSVTWSQVSHGRLNDLTIEVDGSNAALSWSQEDPNRLIVGRLGKPKMTYERNPNAEYTTADARAACRLPPGHPEAFYEAFANIYRDAYVLMRNQDKWQGSSAKKYSTLCPTVADGVEGVLFTHLCMQSNASESSWVRWQEYPK